MVVPLLVIALSTPVLAQSAGMEPAFKSLLIPGWGQYQNGEFETRDGKAKVAGMWFLEGAAILTTAIVGGIAGYPEVWVGIGLFIGSHVYSAFDAFLNAETEPGLELGTAPPSEKVRFEKATVTK
jgi:hypothetical protein